MTKWMLFLTLGIVGAAAILRDIGLKKKALAFVSDDPETKNFGAFPPDIPEDQFESLFI